MTTWRFGLWFAVAALVTTSLIGWQKADPVASSAARLDGAVLFQIMSCSTCHLGPEPRLGQSIEVGPPLAEASAWAGTRRPGYTARAYLIESIREPGVFVSPAYEAPFGSFPGMPDLGLSDAEVAAVVDYLLRG